MAVSAINRLGLLCLTLISVMLAVAFPLHCFPLAVAVAAVQATAGCTLGLALAMITRSRRPVAIYGWLIACGLTFFLLILSWPRADSLDVVLWRGAPDILSNYFDILRGSVFILAMPFLFGRLGQHEPDPLPNDSD